MPLDLEDRRASGEPRSAALPGAQPSDRAAGAVAAQGGPTVSVVVVNWNAGGALQACLASVFSTDAEGIGREVILVDNASTDGSAEAAARAHPQIIHIRNPSNYGFARAVNVGLRRSRCDLALVLNPDAILEPETLPCLVRFMCAHPDVGIVGPRLLNSDKSLQGSARRAPTLRTGLFGRSAPLTRLFPGNALSRRELLDLGHAGPEPLEVDWVSGACLLARRAAWEQVGLMDERFFLFWEDADWCLRLRDAGWRIFYLPLASVVHRAGVCRAQRRVRSTLDFHRSAYRFYRKHHLRSPLHPMIAVVVPGLWLSLALRLAQALWIQSTVTGVVSPEHGQADVATTIPREATRRKRPGSGRLSAWWHPW